MTAPVPAYITQPFGSRAHGRAIARALKAGEIDGETARVGQHLRASGLFDVAGLARNRHDADRSTTAEGIERLEVVGLIVPCVGGYLRAVPARFADGAVRTPQRPVAPKTDRPVSNTARTVVDSAEILSTWHRLKAERPHLDAVCRQTVAICQRSDRVPTAAQLVGLLQISPERAALTMAALSRAGLLHSRISDHTGEPNELKLAA